MGEPFSSIVDDLYSNGVIPSKLNLRIAAFLYGAEKKIRPARYKIPNGLSYLGLIEYLKTTTDADFQKNVTIMKGSSLGWVAEKLHNSVFTDSADVVTLANNKGFLDSLGLKTPSMLGYILPKTYHFFERSAPRELLKDSYEAFNNFMNDSLRARAKELGYSINKIVTMASIVEGETNNPDEMPIIAGVYYNRLKIGMKLQADPTIQFILNGNWKRLTYKDLKKKSPYNTYENIGLPPSPINNPGKNAILAALYPGKNDYLYFVVDKNGKHLFSKSYIEHLKNVREYRKWLNSQKKN